MYPVPPSIVRVWPDRFEGGAPPCSSFDHATGASSCEGKGGKGVVRGGRVRRKRDGGVGVFTER